MSISTNRFMVIVLDGFGIGAMDDAREVRPGDEKASTLGTLLRSRPSLSLPALERLGLMNAFGEESACMRFSRGALWGRASLMHYGADTFWGHQEIMGTLPQKPVELAFVHSAEKTADALRRAGHGVEFKNGLMLVDGAVIVADNLEADPGQNYNVLGALDRISFDRVLTVGRIVRSVVPVARVICFGNPNVGLERILDAAETRGVYAGVSSPRSGVYRDGYVCVHLGRGVDPAEQIPFLLAERGVPVLLFGKVADVVENPWGRSVSCVETGEALSMAFGAFLAFERGFICVNVQGTDLAGHREDAESFIAELELADMWIGRLTERLEPGDILLVMADHGNDPGIGHSRHTREQVPLLVAAPSLSGSSAVRLGDRDTLADVAATAAACFGTAKLPNPKARPLEALKRFWKR